LATGVGIGETRTMRTRRHPPVRPAPRSAFSGYRFPPEVITLAVRWYLRFGLSYRDVEELLAERGIEVDHVSIFRWVQRFAPEFAEAARARQHVIGDRWHVDETYLKIGGTWRYLFRAIDQFGQVIDVFLSPRRDAKQPAASSSERSAGPGSHPSRSPPTGTGSTPRVLDEVLPGAFHDTEVHANALETDHGRLKARLRPMRGLKRDHTARVIVAGHAFIQNLRRGFYDLAPTYHPSRVSPTRSLNWPSVSDTCPRGSVHLARGHCCIGRTRASVRQTPAMRSRPYPRPHSRPAPSSAFAGYRFPPEVITLAVRWYLRFGLSYRDVEELLAERGIEVDHVSIYRWVHRFAPEAARARQHVVGDRWRVDETYLKVGGTWRYLFRAIDQFGQVVDVFLSPRRNAEAARRFFVHAMDRTRISPCGVKTLDRGGQTGGG